MHQGTEPDSDPLVVTALDGPVAVAGAGVLRRELTICLPDWRPSAAAAEAPQIAVRRHRDAFDIRCALLPDGHYEAWTRLDAANALAGALTGTFVARHPDLIQAHAAAVQIGSGLVLLVGDSLAGKSSLGLRLAGRRQRLFADDRLALRLTADGVEGVALGVAPKARLPLPPSTDAAHADYIAARTAARHEGVAFLRLPHDEGASAGECAPVRALVLLQRQDQGPAVLQPFGAAGTLRELLPRCLAPGLHPAALLERVESLVRRLPGYRLSYADSGEAAGVVHDSFA